MGIARQKREAGSAPAPPAPRLTVKTRLVFIDDVFVAEIDKRLTLLNTQRALKGEKAVSWNNFLVYGLAKNGMDAFDVAYKAFEESQALVKPATIDEIRKVVHA